MKKLEIKHLAPYLPYGLRVDYAGDYATLKGVDSNGTLCIDDDNEGCNFVNIKYIKPILRPLSDLNNIIYVDSKKILPYEELYKIRKNVEIYKPLNITHNIEILIDTENYSQEIDLFDGYLIIQKLLEWHFDIYNLMENNLTIDINTLKL